MEREFWTDDDRQLIHELLQSQFGGDFSVDFGRIVFWGGSAGSGFYTGLFSHTVRTTEVDCWRGVVTGSPIRSGDPRSNSGNGPRAGERDHGGLHPQAGKPGITDTTNMSLDWRPRGDLQAPGGHCWGGEYSWETAVGWLLDGTGIPEEPAAPHFRAGSRFRLCGRTHDRRGRCALGVRQTPAQEDAAIWRSVDRGTSWEAVSRVPLIVADIDAVGDALFLTASTPDTYRKQLYRSLDGGWNFTVAGGTDNHGLYSVNEPLVTDRDGKLYVLGRYAEADPRDVYVSDDLGRVGLRWVCRKHVITLY